jgi:outer membrane protein OmpA-like peptidoglycan-associated protein
MPYRKIALRLGCALLLGGLLSPSVQAQAPAQVSAEQILEALAPKPLTRGLSGAPRPAMSEADRAYVDKLRNRTRSLSLTEREHVSAIAKDRPSTDLEVYFDYNSATISQEAEPQLNELGMALRNAKLQDAVILLSGHTDARGSDDYNQKLSERRAESVRSYLKEKFGVSVENLTTAGYGKKSLKNTGDPYAAENRRVQIVNMGTANTAKR